MFGNQLIKASNISRAQLNGQAGASRSKLLKKKKNDCWPVSSGFYD